MVIGALIVSTAVIKAAGPVVLGGRELPPRAVNVVALLAPALLAALVMTETFSHDGSLVIDERAAGVAAAGGVLAVRDSPLLAVILAAAVTAAVRAIG
jgi:DNA integrity scanning protein DisA with diadenylate cyclase activity